MTEEPRDQVLEHLYAHETHGVLPDSEGRAARLVSGILSDLETLDSEIEAVSEHWAVSRMPVIDRNILRLGLYELKNDKAVPTNVVIAEALRLASTYSTEKSASFVNGILSTLAKQIRPSS